MTLLQVGYSNRAPGFPLGSNGGSKSLDVRVEELDQALFLLYCVIY